MDEIHLRPLSIAEILQETLNLYVKDWPVYVGIVAAVQVPFGLATALWFLDSGVEVPTVDFAARLTLDAQFLDNLVRQLAVVFVVASLNLLLTASAVYGGVVEAVRERYSGLTPTFSSATFFGWRKFLDLLWASLLAGLTLSLLSTLSLTCIGALVALPGMVFLATRWLFFPQAIILENLKAIDSLRRSSLLVKGQFWRSLGLGFLLTAIALAITSLPTNFLAFLFFVPALPSSFVVLALIAANVALTIIATPIQMIGLTAAYFDLRARASAIAP